LYLRFSLLDKVFEELNYQWCELLFVFDGIDGSGKTTALNTVYGQLRQRGIIVRKFKEPSIGPYGLHFRRIARNSLNRAYANHLLILDRVWDVKNNILPALKRGEIVLLDRYYYSHIFQSKDISDAHRTIHKNRKKFPRPTMTFIFNASPLSAKRRIFSSREKLEALERKLTHAQRMYLTMQVFPEVQLINANRNASEVAVKVGNLINHKIGNG